MESGGLDCWRLNSLSFNVNNALNSNYPFIKFIVLAENPGPLHCWFIKLIYCFRRKEMQQNLTNLILKDLKPKTISVGN